MTFLSLGSRSLSLLKGHLTIPQRSQRIARHPVLHDPPLNSSPLLTHNYTPQKPTNSWENLVTKKMVGLFTSMFRLLSNKGTTYSFHLCVQLGIAKGRDRWKKWWFLGHKKNAGISWICDFAIWCLEKVNQTYSPNWCKMVIYPVVQSLRNHQKKTNPKQQPVT